MPFKGELRSRVVMQTAADIPCMLLEIATNHGSPLLLDIVMASLQLCNCCSHGISNGTTAKTTLWLGQIPMNS